MSKYKLFNRELSWLSFNHRVLQEAQDYNVPLMERVKFLAIFSSNLEEFFRVRVASLRSLLELKKKSRKELDFDPEDLLKKIHKKVDELQFLLGKIFNGEILPALNVHNIFIKNETELNEEQKIFVKEFFYERVQPFISPMALVKKKISPFLKTGALYLAVRMTSVNKTKNKIKNKSGNKNVKKRFVNAMVDIPTDKLPRFIVLPSAPNEINVIFLDDIIRFSLSKIFKDYKIEETVSVKLTRDAELYIDDEFTGSLPDKIKKNLSKRLTGAPSRFLYDKNISKEFLIFLKESLSLKNQDLIPGARYHNFSDFFNLPHHYIKELEFEKLRPLNIKATDSFRNIFDAVRKEDILLHFPYQSFDQVIKFFETASTDENVTEIKITLYRAAKNSAIVSALLNALNNGIKVTVFVEIKARFDEELNLEYADVLKKSGAEIIYSIPGLKVHAKLALVIRKENKSLKNYCYLSTGNFNENTSKIYTDFGFFTSDENITNEISELFKYLEGRLKNPEFKHVLVAQFNMKKEFLKLIGNEIKNALEGKAASILIKLNSLEDKKMIEKLYEAGKAGVKINIIVRGVCCLIPGVKGLSKNISAVSIVGRFLEHSRVYVFHNNGDEKIYLSSADWMKRNLSRRIETAFPVYDKDLKKEILDLMEIQLSDNVKSRIIDAHQTNKFRQNESGKNISSQIESYEYLKRF
ncbi:MAG TPA: polyphosphate kinase 1 [Ignavibacteria bacterium]|nr:polyphosphate kinase 1 [Ignavibacteria bacterium]HRJ99908.1 polyphosphate kinase 1 [Ignavibacteria bacterium]